MTELIRRVRDMLDQAGSSRGRDLVLGVRVPEALEECHNCGLDVPTWIAEALIDYVAPQDAMYSDCNAPYQEFSQLTKATKCELIPGLLPYCANLDRTGPPLTLENYRALAHSFARQGADGVSMYNFQMHWDAFWKSTRDPGSEAMYPLALSYLRDLRDPTKIAAGARHYLFHPMWGGSMAFGSPGMTAGGIVRDTKIHLERTEKQPYGQYHFRLYENFDEIVFAKLFFRATGLGPYDRIAVDINGTAIPADRVRHIWHSDGRHPNQGRPLPAHTTCIIDLSSPLIRDGDNALGVHLLSSGLPEGAVVIDEVEVTVLPR